MNIKTLYKALTDEIAKARGKAICYWRDLHVEVMLEAPFPTTWKLTVKGDWDDRTGKQCYALFLSDRGRTMDGGILSHQITPHKGKSEFYTALIHLFDLAPWKDKDILAAWDAFSDVPMNPETEEMEEPFLHFPAGTFREDIWHFFDENYSEGVHALLYGSDEPTKPKELGSEVKNFIRRFGNDVTAQMAINALEESLQDSSIQAVTIPVGWLNELLDHAMVKTHESESEALLVYLREEVAYRLHENLEIEEPSAELVEACAQRLTSHSEEIFNVGYIDDTLREIAGDYGEWDED